ncbi:MAG: hypothetical protein ACJAX8_001479, partial [Flavobacteriales bacterium]
GLYKVLLLQHCSARFASESESLNTERSSDVITNINFENR